MSSNGITNDNRITHSKVDCRFNIEVDGYTGYVEYRIEDGALDILHTIVPKEIGGRGLASALVAATYAYADEAGLRRAATCSYAVKWLERHQ